MTPLRCSPITTMIFWFLMRSLHGVASSAWMPAWRSSSRAFSACSSLENLNPWAVATVAATDDSSRTIKVCHMVSYQEVWDRHCVLRSSEIQAHTKKDRCGWLLTFAPLSSQCGLHRACRRKKNGEAFAPPFVCKTTDQ